MDMPVGERFARAIAAKDAPALLELLSSDDSGPVLGAELGR